MDPLLSRYPFLPEARERVGQEATLEELLHDRVYAAARRRGRDRAIAAVDDGEVKGGDPATAAEALMEQLSYAVARMLVSVTDDRYVARRHALAEAVRVKRFLDREEPARFLRVARALGVELERADGGGAGGAGSGGGESGARRRVAPRSEPSRSEGGGPGYVIHFADYLRLAAPLKEQGWKLINQPLAGGRIVLPQQRAARLLQEALRARIEDELPLPVPPAVEKALAGEVAALVEAAKERKSQFDGDGFGEVDLEIMPPCMKHILGMLQAGENAPHSARFAITSFLHTIGLDSEAIIELFAKAPDFREDMTRYQVEHITGVSSPTEYSPPGCDTMKTHGICYNPDRWCKHVRDDGTLSVTHPLSYYRWAKKRKEWAARNRPDGGDGDGGEDEDKGKGKDGDAAGGEGAEPGDGGANGAQ